MNELKEFLSLELFAISGQPVTTGQLLLTPILLVVGLLVMRWLGKLIRLRMAKQQVDADLIHLTVRIFYVATIIALVFTSLELLQVSMTAFAFASGAIAIGLGFGAQNIINNFISGWILMWERPIKIGDFLEIGDTRGTVEAINTRSTRIRRIDGVHMLVPNSHLLENMVVNWTLVDRLTRTQVRLGVAYGSPVKQVAELIEQAVDEQPDVLQDPAPTVYFEDFGDNALIFDVYFWIHATAERDLRGIRSSIRFRIDELFRDHGIVIAFPQRDVHIDGALRLVDPRDTAHQ